MGKDQNFRYSKVWLLYILPQIKHSYVAPLVIWFNGAILPSGFGQLSINDIHDLVSVCISLDLFRIQLQLRDDIYSLHRGRFYVWASELFSFIMAFR